MSGRDRDNSDLVALYDAGTHELPSHNIDQAILRAARRHAQWRARLPMRVAAAVLLICAVGFGGWQFLPHARRHNVDARSQLYGYSEGRTRTYLMGAQILDTATTDGAALLTAGQ